MQNRINNLCAFFFVIELFSQTFIYSIFAILQVEATFNTQIYIALFGISVVLIFLGVISKPRINYRSLALIAFILVVIIHYLVVTTNSMNAVEKFPYFIMWGVIPSLLIIFIDKQVFYTAIKYAEIVNLIQAIAAIFVVLTFFATGNRIVNNLSFGGETYQTISYVSATAVGLFLYYTFFCDNRYRFRVFQNKLINVIYIGLSILSIIVTFLSGGRGGAILVIIYLLIFFCYWNSKNISIRLQYKVVVNVLFIILLGYIVWISSNNETIIGSLQRTFSYISSSGLDLSQTSYRDVLYRDAINYWKDRPFVGYGPMNYPGGIYPHNYFFDLLLTGGLIYFILGLIFIIRIIKQMIYTLADKDYALFYTFIGISTFVMLMFSGSFYTNIRFWMCGVFFWAIYSRKGRNDE